MQKKWKAGAAAFGIALLAAPVQSASAETVTTPAPPGVSEAVALNVLDIVAIGHTIAKADDKNGEATANSIEIAGEAVFGGTQKGKGTQKGELLDTGETPLGQLAIAPYEATVTESSTKRTSESDAALLKLVLIDKETLTLNVLHTHSKAEHNGQQSKGNTSSDGANLNLGDGSLQVVVLHSETSSEAKGNSSYVLGINDNYLLTNEDAGDCAIEVPSVVALACLQAKGGLGSSAAAVAEGTVLGERAAVVSGTSKFGAAPAAVLPADITREPDAPAAAELGAGPATNFAVTGQDVFAGLIVGITMILAGLLAVAWAQPKRVTA
ncbi:MAG TPA: hypothetical protein VM030_06915 [Acidimicrobiales bacterium]|nr:hypothetical protein [Acidimicrobiales bacterium]